MKRLKYWLKTKLGIETIHHQISQLLELNASLRMRVAELEEVYKNLASIGVDVHFKEPHMILIYSEIGGGQLRHIPAHFSSMTDLNEFCHRLKQGFNTERITYDLPHGCQKFFD